MSFRLVAFLAATALLVGCNKPPAAGAGPGPAGGETSPPEVSVVTARSEAAPIVREQVGRLAATRTAQVRARVAGIILTRVYTEGTDVEQGDVLFEIDPAQLEAKLNAAEASLAKAEADALNAAETAKRYTELRQKKTISQQDVDTAVASERATAAAVLEARANVASARLDLGYATVRAPISGRAGRALVTEGALVGQSDATLLTTVEQIDPIYINFSQSVAEVEALARLGGGLGGGLGTGPSVEVLLPSGTPYPETGRMNFSDLAVDPSTGAVSLRAILPNPRRVLLPGMFVTLRLTEGELEDAFLLPQAVLSRDAQGAFVMVVGADGKVQQRRVESHGMTRSDWILTGDLADGDQVIVAGLQKIKPGAVATVAPEAPTSEPASESDADPAPEPINAPVAEPVTAPTGPQTTTAGDKG